MNIQFADWDGDGRADYIAVNTQNGSASGYLNGGQRPGGWIWYSVPTIASGVGAAGGSAYRFADVNGDGRADYLAVGLFDSGDPTTTAPRVELASSGTTTAQFSPGIVFREGMAEEPAYLTDVNGDGKADYAAFNGNANVGVIVNTGDFQTVAGLTGSNFKYADGGGPYTFAFTTGAGTNVLFANDNWDDCLVIGAGDSVIAFLSLGVTGNNITHRPLCQLAAGIVPPGTTAKFADINEDARADYLVVDN